MSFNYRGLYKNHPGYQWALLGTCVPADPNGSLTPALHNLVEISVANISKSQYPSWTTNIRIAVMHATRDDDVGLVLRVPQQPPGRADTWFWAYSPDVWGELELLLAGVRHNCKVFSA